MNIISNNTIEMTSQDLAVLTSKRHDSVKRTIETLVSKGVIQEPHTVIREDINGLGLPLRSKSYVFNLENKRDTYIIVAQLSPEFTARLVDRWQELEAKLNLPQDYPTALRMLANEVEQKQLALAQRDEAIRTKALIGSRREATAMATASIAVREKNRLADELGRGTNWKAAKAVPWVKKYLVVSKGMWIQFGKKLKSVSDEIGIPAIKVESDRFGQVNAYHVDVIEKLRCKLEADDNMLCKYRVKP